MTKTRIDETPHSNLSSAEILEHGWRYFSLHAAQRLTLFNYFIAVSGLTTAATAATLQGSPKFSILGIILGLLLCLLALIFFKLDQRTSILIKASEAALADAEKRFLPVGSRLFVRDSSGHNAGARSLGMEGWTYGRSLRISFVVVGIIGLALSTISLLRAAEVIRWDFDSSREAQNTKASITATVSPLVLVSTGYMQLY